MSDTYTTATDGPAYVDLDGVAEQAAAVLLYGGSGFTYDLTTAGPVVGHGYAVGGNPECPEQVISDWTELPTWHLIGAIARYAERIMETGGVRLGGWVEETREDGVTGYDLYLDAPTIVMDREAAVALGRERGERAIYDLEEGNEIRLDGKVGE